MIIVLLIKTPILLNTRTDKTYSLINIYDWNMIIFCNGRKLNKWEVALFTSRQGLPRPQQSIFRSWQSKTGIIVYGSQPLGILLSIFLFLLFLARERGRNAERPLTLFPLEGVGPPILISYRFILGCIVCAAVHNTNSLSWSQVATEPYHD